MKQEVLESLTQLTRLTPEAREVSLIAIKMLDIAYKRPSASDISGYLLRYLTAVNVNQHKLQSSTAVSFDGIRLLRFSNSKNSREVSFLDKARCFIEAKARARIDWRPFPPVQYPCPIGSTRIHWKVSASRECLMCLMPLLTFVYF